MKEKFLHILKKEMQPALGVTEPAAIALASAKAYQAVGGDLISIQVITDAGIYKNGFSCGIPGTDEKGNELAAILGALIGDPDLELNVLKNIKKEDFEKAKELRKQKIATVEIKKEINNIFIDARVTTNKGNGRVVIQGTHTNIVLIEVNGTTKQKAENIQKAVTEKNSLSLAEYKLEDFIKFIDSVSLDEINFTLDAVKVNKELAKAGINGAGMKVGSALSELLHDKTLGNSIITQAQILTACAIDARMGGLPKPAMSICGSGAHGIIATMPLAAIADNNGIEKDRLARAIALSYLVTIYVKEHSGRLSAFCGCAIVAGTGASAGIVYLLKGTAKQIEYTINNMAANITGVICDGGNFGCSLKAMTAAGAAITSALFALKNVTIPTNSGIVDRNVEQTMKNMGKIAYPGMVKTDNTILDIMINRTK